ncbi:alkaline phosphatase [Aerococcus urinaeequi]|uniref:Alkaline phosphatase n=1 Tax=Aerococcus urinaeequi TaxID=51665 RepID=A0A7M1KTT6_9LACT|nr:alkaline phosphatase [Aerococcus urinaeequi]QOQ79584.1 alkaline phosphatase [Aerococcus urinaeequi]
MVASNEQFPHQPKNIIFMVSDGMSVSLASAYREYLHQDVGHFRNPSIFNQYLVGQQSTYSFDPWATITDSAASSTAMATGVKTMNGVIGLDKQLSRVDSALEIAKLNNKKTGIVVTAEISHATPAGFAAHVESRLDYFDIADQYLDDTIKGKQKIDVMLGGGRDHFIRPDRNLAQEFENLGYDIVHTKHELFNSHNPQILGLFSEFGVPMAIDRWSNVTPSLGEMVHSAIRRLDTGDEGFFLMVEGSQIDWAAHHKDVVGIMSEIDDFAGAFQVAIDFAKQDGDTLVIATSDHATGGMSMGTNNIDSWLPDYIRKVKATPQHIAELTQETNDWVEVIRRNIQFELSSTEKNQLRSIYHTYVYTYEEKVSRLTQAIRDIVDRRSNTGWTTGNHTGEDVNVYAYGPGSDYFRGWHENAENGQLLKILAAGLSPDDDNY